MTAVCIDCGREQQEYHPDYPDLRDWFYGPHGKQRCGDCAIAAGTDGRSLHDIDSERKMGGD